MGDDRFCKDCKWMMTAANPSAETPCRHEKAHYGNDYSFYVTGEATGGQYGCGPMRAGICGMAGTLWEAKTS